MSVGVGVVDGDDGGAVDGVAGRSFWVGGWLVGWNW